MFVVRSSDRSTHRFRLSCLYIDKKLLSCNCKFWHVRTGSDGLTTILWVMVARGFGSALLPLISPGFTEVINAHLASSTLTVIKISWLFNSELELCDSIRRYSIKRNPHQWIKIGYFWPSGCFSGVTTAPADPATQGGPQGLGALLS
jgi:hypothetical protein